VPSQIMSSSDSSLRQIRPRRSIHSSSSSSVPNRQRPSEAVTSADGASSMLSRNSRAPSQRA
jgi:hypothetical protein